jgi:hypothetical protein
MSWPFHRKKGNAVVKKADQEARDSAASLLVEASKRIPDPPSPGAIITRQDLDRAIDRLTTSRPFSNPAAGPDSAPH